MTIPQRRPTLPSDERHRVLHEFNQTDTPFPAGERIETLFEAQVARAPGAIALVADGESLTYAEVSSRADQLASYMSEDGVRAGDFVAVRMPRSAQTVIAQIAILKCGAVYVPLDPELPHERQIFIVDDCRIRHILQDSRLGDVISLSRASSIDCAHTRGMDPQAAKPVLAKDVISPAYVMYTSGSSGRPKGVVVSHTGILRLVINNSCVPIEPQDCVGFCNNPAFDPSTFEIWGALLNGARLAVIPKPAMLDPARFAQVLAKHGVTILALPTALLNRHVVASPNLFSKLRYLMFGGETANPAIVRKLLREGAPRHLVHAYGPTEATMTATSWLVKSIDEDAISVPIGRPISNTRIYILDEEMQPVAIGMPGEIYIGGPGVACEYLNQPQLTEERFLPDPFLPRPGGRLYRTGDFGCWCPDGSIEFLGRRDSQVKVRGFRIELGEVEGYLNRCPGVSEGVVLLREDHPNGSQLVAYVTLLPDAAVSVSQLRTHMISGLPEYMVPTAYVMLDRLPLTGNGKVDRNALPAPDASVVVRRQHEPPQGATELAIAAIWQEILTLDKLSRYDNFFELGGNSLLGMDLIDRLAQTFEVCIPFITLFQYPTIEELSRHLEQQHLSYSA